MRKMFGVGKPYCEMVTAVKGCYLCGQNSGGRVAHAMRLGIFNFY